MDQQIDLVPITHNSDLAQFGLDAERFIMFSSRDKIGGKEWHGPCPFCGGSDRFSVSNGRYHCRTCNKGGVLVALSKDYKPLSEKERKEIYEKLAIEEKKAKRQQAQKRNDLNRLGLHIKFHNNLLKNRDVLQQLETDGLDRSVVDRFMIGFNPSFRFYDKDANDKYYQRTENAITFPIFSGKKCINIRCRILSKNIPPSGKYRPIWAGLGLAFSQARIPGADYCIFTEGEKKAYVLWKYGFQAIGLWGVLSWKEEWIPWFQKNFKHNIVLFDGDNPGVIAAAERFAEALGGSVLTLGIKGKIDDLLVSGELSKDQLSEIINSMKEEPW